MTKETKQRPILAICYDFDKTLTPTDMQAQGYIQSVGCDVEKFWSETDAMAAENDMDSNLAYMLKMAQEAEGNIVFSRQTLAEYGSRVELFPGVVLARFEAGGRTRLAMTKTGGFGHESLLEDIKRFIEAQSVPAK